MLFLINPELEERSPPPSWSHALKFHGAFALLGAFILFGAEMAEKMAAKGSLFDSCTITVKATSDMTVAPVIICQARPHPAPGP